MTKTVAETAEVVVGKIRRNPGKTTLLAGALAMLGALYSGSEKVFEVGQWFAGADVAHAQSKQNEKDIKGLIDLEIKKQERAKSEAEAEKKAKARTVKWCESGVIVNRDVCRDVGVYLP